MKSSLLVWVLLLVYATVVGSSGYLYLDFEDVITSCNGCAVTPLGNPYQGLSVGSGLWVQRSLGMPMVPGGDSSASLINWYYLPMTIEAAYPFIFSGWFVTDQQHNNLTIEGYNKQGYRTGSVTFDANPHDNYQEFVPQSFSYASTRIVMTTSSGVTIDNLMINPMGSYLLDFEDVSTGYQLVQNAPYHGLMVSNANVTDTAQVQVVSGTRALQNMVISSPITISAALACTFSGWYAASQKTNVTIVGYNAQGRITGYIILPVNQISPTYTGGPGVYVFQNFPYPSARVVVSAPVQFYLDDLTIDPTTTLEDTKRTIDFEDITADDQISKPGSTYRGLSWSNFWVATGWQSVSGTKALYNRYGGCSYITGTVPFRIYGWFAVSSPANVTIIGYTPNFVEMGRTTFPANQNKASNSTRRQEYVYKELGFNAYKFCVVSSISTVQVFVDDVTIVAPIVN